MKQSRILFALLAAASAAPASAAPCDVVEVPASWQRNEQAAFALDLPPGATFTRPGPSLDFESGVYTYADGRIVRYQYGFAVDGLDGVAELRDTTSCTATIAGREVTYYRFKTEAGEFAFGFHIPELRAMYPETGELSDALTVLGFANDASIQQDGLAVLRGLALSHVPYAAQALYGSADPGQGVSVNFTPTLATVVWATYDPNDGRQFWVTGIGDLGDVAYHGTTAESGDVPYTSVPLTLYRSPTGRFPGAIGPAPNVQPWGTGEFRVKDDCAHGELEYSRADGTLSGTIEITRVAPVLGVCSRFD